MIMNYQLVNESLNYVNNLTKIKMPSYTAYSNESFNPFQSDADDATNFISALFAKPSSGIQDTNTTFVVKEPISSEIDNSIALNFLNQIKTVMSILNRIKNDVIKAITSKDSLEAETLTRRLIS